MTIEEYADALNLELEIRRYPNQFNRYIASFKGCETKDEPESSVLSSTYGQGYGPLSAIDDYASKIKGKVLVINAMGGDRREYLVPREFR